MNVTLDVFSALIDSRTGGSRVFDQIAGRQRWALHGPAFYRAWDSEHKRLQRECVRWEPFTALGRQALLQVLDEHRLRGDVDAAMTQLWASLGDWPLWPDVTRGVPTSPARTGWACSATSTTPCWPAPGWRRCLLRRTW